MNNQSMSMFFLNSLSLLSIDGTSPSFFSVRINCLAFSPSSAISYFSIVFFGTNVPFSWFSLIRILSLLLRISLFCCLPLAVVIPEKAISFWWLASPSNKP